MLKRLVERASRLVSLLSLGGFGLSGISLVMLATAITAEVVSRKIFGHPLYDTITIGRVVMLSVGFLAASYALKQDRHVTITLVIRHLPKRIAGSVRVCALLLGLFFTGLMTWRTYQFAMASKAEHVLLSGQWAIPVYLPQMVIPIGLGLLTLEYLVLVLKENPEHVCKNFHPEKQKEGVSQAQ